MAHLYSDDPTAFGAHAGAFNASNASNAQYSALSAPSPAACYALRQTGAATFGSGAITTQPGYDRMLAAVIRAKLSTHL